MSGHSKWSKIKRQKGAADQKKGNLFTKLGQAITLAVREGGGGNEDMNFMLRMAVEKAKEANMPKDTIERAINRGLGKSDSGAALEQITYEVVGPEGTALLLDCSTDNKNRTIGEMRKILNKTEFTLGSGSVSWQFSSKGMFDIEIKGNDEEAATLDIMDISGVEDVKILREKGLIRVITAKEDFNEVYQALQKKSYTIDEAQVGKIPSNRLDLDEDLTGKIEKLKEDLLELEDIESIWDNVNLQ